MMITITIININVVLIILAVKTTLNIILNETHLRFLLFSLFLSLKLSSAGSFQRLVRIVTESIKTEQES